MAIQFVCPNPRCGKLIQVPADRAGQQVSCPTCRQVVLVPGSAGSLTSRDEAVADAYQRFLRGLKEHEAPAEEAPPPPSAPSAPGRPAPLPPHRPVAVAGAGAEDLSRVARAEAPLPGAALGKAGWTRAWWRSPAPLAGNFWRHCLAGIRHSGADAGSVLAASLCLAILTTYFRCLLGPHALLPAEWAPRWALLAGLGVLVALLGGYCGMVCLSLTHAAVASGGRMQTWLRPTAGTMLKTGLLGLAVAVVYVLPVVTLPLLPLAALTLSLTHDGRAFCFRWQLRSAFGYGEGFAVLWLVWLLAMAVVVAVWTLVNLAGGALAENVVAEMTRPEAAATRAVIWFLGAFVAAVLAMLPICGIARCTGLLARLRPGVLDSLPTSCRSVVTWGIILVCLVLGALVTSTWIVPCFTPAAP